jgi:hypothetical protein
MGEIADVMHQAMYQMYVDLIEEGLSPDKAYKRMLAFDRANWNPGAEDAAELAIEVAERRRFYESYRRSEEWRAKCVLVRERERTAQGRDLPLCQECGGGIKRGAGAQLAHR